MKNFNKGLDSPWLLSLTFGVPFVVAWEFYDLQAAVLVVGWMLIGFVEGRLWKR